MREKMKEEKEDRKDQVQAGSDEKKGLTRRKFLSTAAASGAAAAFVPRRVLRRGFTPPSDLLNIAGVGVGGMGRQNLINLASQNIVALCDVDWGYADQGFARLDSDIEKLRDRLEHPDRAPASGQTPAKFERVKAKARLDGMIRLKTEHVPKAKRYKDYREMLDRQKDIDAVLVATADHMHAPIALAAMDLHKHVYVQKPLTWSVDEARKMARAAKESKVATQMGNQGHSMDDARTAVEYILAGAIGQVREIHIWTNRPLGFWPQGVPRPEPLKEPADQLRWHGQGLNLGMPTSVETVSTPFNGASYPQATMTFYEFPARGPLPPVKLTWYDGGLMPNKPAELGDEELKQEGGALLIGSKGKLLHDTYGLDPRLLPKSLNDSFGKPPVKLPRIPGEAHEMNWVDAAKGKTEPSCPFEYAARLTEVMLLGIVALRAGRKIFYDGENMRVTNLPQANDYLRREYRQGWSV